MFRKKASSAFKKESIFTVNHTSEQGSFLHNYYDLGTPALPKPYETLEIEMNNHLYKSSRLLFNKERNIYVEITIRAYSEKTTVIQLEFDTEVSFENLVVFFNAKWYIKCLMTQDPYNSKLYESRIIDMADRGYCYFCNRSYTCNCKYVRLYSGLYHAEDLTIMYQFSNNDESSWSNAFENLLKTKEYSDFTITVNKTSFKVHKVIVAAKSPILKKMIDDDMSGKKTNKIVITSEEPANFGEILKFIYSGKCNISKKFAKIFALAYKYEIDDLKEICKRYTLNNLNMENIVEIFKTVNKYGIEDLKDDVFKFLNKNESKLAENVNFIKCLKDIMTTENIDYISKIVFKYNMYIAKDVKAFIKENQEEVYKNANFKDLIKKNPKWLK